MGSRAEGDGAGRVKRSARVVIADSDPRARDTLRQMLYEAGMEIAGLAGDGSEAVQMARWSSPDAIIVDDGLLQPSALETGVAIQGVAPQVASLLLTANDGAETLRSAMQNGFRDVLPKPPDAALMRAAMDRILEHRRVTSSEDFQQALDPDKLPTVICVTGAKGGVGKTIVACNLALCYAGRGRPTALVDLYTQFGDVASVLNISPRRGLAELSGRPDDIDAALLRAYTEHHPSGLSVLIGSNRPLVLDAISVGALDRILATLKRQYRFIVLDVPPYMHTTTLHALSIAQSVLLVCNLFDYTTIADTKQLYETLEGAYVPRDRIKLVVNRVDPRNRFQLSDVENIFGQAACTQIPNEPRIVSLLNSGLTSYAALDGTAMSESMGLLADDLSRPWAGSGASPADGASHNGTKPKEAGRVTLFGRKFGWYGREPRG